MHKHKRKVLSKGLSDQSMRAFEPTMLDSVDIFVRNLAMASIKSKTHDKWSSPINIGKSFKHLSLDIMGLFGFGQSFKMQTSPENRFIPGMIEGILVKGGLLLQCQVFDWMRFEKYFYPRVHVARQKYVATVSKLVADRLKEDKSAKNDLFSAIFDAQYSNEGKHENIETMPVSEMFTESGFLLIAGESAFILPVPLINSQN